MVKTIKFLVPSESEKFQLSLLNKAFLKKFPHLGLKIHLYLFHIC